MALRLSKFRCRSWLTINVSFRATLPPQLELRRDDLVQCMAELAVEFGGGESGVDDVRLVVLRQRTLRDRARDALRLQIAFEAIAGGGEDVGDPDIPAAGRSGDAKGPGGARRRGHRAEQLRKQTSRRDQAHGGRLLLVLSAISAGARGGKRGASLRAER